MKLSTIMLATLSLTAAMSASALTQGTAKLISHHESSTNPALRVMLTDVVKDKTQAARLQAFKAMLNAKPNAVQNGDYVNASVSIEPTAEVTVNKPINIGGLAKTLIANESPNPQQYTVDVEYCSAGFQNECYLDRNVYQVAPNTFVDITRSALVENTFNTTGNFIGTFAVSIQRNDSNRFFASSDEQYITVTQDDRK